MHVGGLLLDLCLLLGKADVGLKSPTRPEKQTAKDWRAGPGNRMVNCLTNLAKLGDILHPLDFPDVMEHF